MAWDRVHTVNDYHDGPRLGVADVDGVPHIYEREFDHGSDEHSDAYLVSPVDESLLALVLEDWEIWLRWESAFRRGEVAIESHPALPQDRERHEALETAIGDRLKVDRAQARCMKARFGTSPRNGDTIVEWRTGELNDISTPP
jgi:hypothetical protein